MSGDHLYSKHAETVEAVITTVCRRHRLAGEDGEELGSRFRLKLVDNDSFVLRRFEGRSSIRTYLITVCERVLADWRTSEWGRWRPCEEARRLGPLAIELDRLLTREGMPFEHAVEQLLSCGMASSRADIDQIRPRLAVRQSRWLESLEALEDIAASGGDPDEEILRREQQARVSKVGMALAAALRSISPREQLMVRLRFQEGLTVGRIAAVLGEAEKPMFRLFKRLLDQLQSTLVAAGISWQDVAVLFENSSLDIEPALSVLNPGKEKKRPSSENAPEGPHV